MEQRTWHHSENPEGEPSAATYRLGCRCTACSNAYRTYLAAYRARQSSTMKNSDGTKVYHNHVGQPSRSTARRHRCTHPRCLYLAGLYLDRDGTVRHRGTDARADGFALPATAA